MDAEIYSVIGRELKERSPVANTLVVTLANGMANSGYIPNDAAFGAYTFQVLSSRLKPGCAETSIVNGWLDLLQVASRWDIAEMTAGSGGTSALKLHKQASRVGPFRGPDQADEY